VSESNPAPVPELEARIEELEIRLTHLEYALQGQGEELLHLQQTNTLLAHQLRELGERLRALSDAPSGDPSAEPPPPHY
jgi:SlyX protein